MQITLDEGEKITVTSMKGVYGVHVVLECKNGEILNRTDAKRDIQKQNGDDKSEN